MTEQKKVENRRQSDFSPRMNVYFFLFTLSSYCLAWPLVCLFSALFLGFVHFFSLFIKLPL